MASEGLQLCEKLTACGEQLILMLDQSKVGNGERNVDGEYKYGRESFTIALAC